MSDKIVYLFGAGSTEAEISHQGKIGETLLDDLGNHIYEMSNKIGGKYSALVRDFSLQPQDQDIELLMSLIESSPIALAEISTELKQLYRSCLVERITKNNILPIITSCLLRLHKNYGDSMGSEGEELLGFLSTNNDSLIENAFCDKNSYSGLNCGIQFFSDSFHLDKEIPPVLKLHGSFNWRIVKDRLEISNEFETDQKPEFSGWVPPSLIKKPYIDKPLFRDIWEKANEILSNCDILRVIGQSLRTSDLPLLSLIFTSQIARKTKYGNAYTIELIIPEKEAEGTEESKGIIQRLGFLTGFKRLSELDVYSSDEDAFKESNPYYYWITRKISQIEINNPKIAEDDIIMNKLFGGN